MTLSKAKLDRLEAKINKRSSKGESNQLNVSKNWLDFARTCKIRSAGNVTYFDPYPYQIDLVELMLNHSVCIAKARQMGISETITCFMLWRACLNPGYLGLVFSKTQTDSSLIARRMKRMIEGLGLKTATENLTDIEILGGGRILFRNSNPESARGIESVVDVFLDELAFLDTGKEVYDALAPAQQMVGDAARVFAVSTPNGKAGFYWDLLNSGNGDIDVESLCKKVSDGDVDPFQSWIDSGNWAKVILHWKCHPGYGTDSEFLNKIHVKQKLSWTTINQEYNLSFQDSESNFFDSATIRDCAIGSNENPIDDTFYMFGIDSSQQGDDYSCCSVIKYEKEIFSLVHLYRKRKETMESHLWNINKLIQLYKPVIVGVETNSGGQIWYEELVKNNFGIRFKKFVTTHESKITILSRVKLLLESQKLNYPSNSPLVDELLNFKRGGKDGNFLSAPSGKHDDCIMSLAVALYVSDQWLFKV